MSWAVIVSDQLVGPLGVPQGTKINSASYCNLLEEFMLL